ncbi:MAG: B12-binding domain-containing radical SAM protein [Mangrovibacterium sp.]
MISDSSDALLIYIYNDIRNQKHSEPQLGLYYLAEYANKFGFSVIVRSYSSNNAIISEICETIKNYSCRIVGFYTDCENVWILRRVMPELKATNKIVSFILGGPQISAAKEQTLRRIPDITCGVIGEGEITFLRLLQLKDLSFSDLAKIKGLALLWENEFHLTGIPDIVLNLDDIPFPRIHLLKPNNDIPFSQIITGRGCIGHCAFCFEGSKSVSKPRVRSIPNCIEEIEYLVNQFPWKKYITILDDTFVLSRERTIQFCELMIQRFNGKIKWYCEGRVDVLSKIVDLLPLMQKAGLIRIQLGGESGSQSVLNAYNKGTTTEQLKKVVLDIYNSNICSVYINFIIGGAFETAETFEETLLLAKQLIDIAPGCASVGASLYSPAPGSPMYITPELYGIKIIDQELVRGSEGNFPFAETDTLSQYKLLNYYYRFINEIREYYSLSLYKLSNDRINELYKLAKEYNCTTEWYDILKINKNFNFYFESLGLGCFKSFQDLDPEEIYYSIPVRTTEPTTDGFAYYRKNRKGEEIRNSDIENAVISLSSGKLSFSEIMSIIEDNKLCNKSRQKKIKDIYKKLDEELNVIWKYKF